MVDYEYIEDGTRIKHYSDANLRIMKNETGEIYDDAADIIPCPYTYSETEEPIPKIDDDVNVDE